MVQRKWGSVDRASFPRAVSHDGRTETVKHIFAFTCEDIRSSMTDEWLSLSGPIPDDITSVPSDWGVVKIACVPLQDQHAKDVEISFDLDTSLDVEVYCPWLPMTKLFLSTCSLTVQNDYFRGPMVDSSLGTDTDGGLTLFSLATCSEVSPSEP